MRDRIDLSAQGIRIYAGRLYNHDYLWFSSTEISKIAASLPMIHNYALSYAISGYSYGVYFGNTPRYDEDLQNMPVYATPARPVGPVTRTRFTQNAVNSVTLRTGEKKVFSHLGSINTPEIGWRVVLNPVWSSESEDRDGGFNFYLFARAGFLPPTVVRLGKKGCPVRLRWEEISSAVAVFREQAVRPTHAVNPLDIQGQIITFEPVPIPPHLVLRVVEITNDWFVFFEQHRIHVPQCFTGH